MKKLQLTAVRSQQKEILRDLMLLGCVEIRDPGDEPAEEILRSLKRADTGMAFRRRSEQSSINRALKVLDTYAPAKKGLLSPLPEVSAEKLLDESMLEKCLSAAQSIQAVENEVRSLAAQESKERALVEAMTPWLSMDFPLECKGTRSCDLMLGAVPVASTISAVEEALAELEASVTQVSEDKTSRYLAVVYSKDAKEPTNEALRECGFSPISMAGLKGTPAQVLRGANETLEQLAKDKQAEIDKIVAAAEYRDMLQLGSDTLATMISREEIAERLLNTESTFFFEGWLTAPDEEKLAATLSKYDCAWETEDPDPEHPEEVPVKLKNNGLTEPYNMVTEMYSLPAYNGLDPNPFIMPFFALFFGIMFADMAYGLLLLIGGLLVKFKMKPKKGGMKNMAGLLIEGGIATFLMGFLTGGFFGDAITVIGSWFGQTWSAVPNFGAIHIGDIVITLPLNLTSGNNPLYVLIAAIALGAIHLFLGTIIGCYLKIRDGEVVDAVLNDLCWWVIIIGAGVFALAGTPIVVYIGLGMMVLGQLITGKGFGKITGIFSAIYNGATGYLGDFLSYSRLMALMLAGSVIASVFNQLGGLGNTNGMTVGGTILFIIVFAIGHTLNFGLNIIGCFVHTLRLQYLEFFGKWYRDGGKAFKPLTIKTKYYDINE
ncbi:MAG: V-type ATP synthase subunit I [Oscillospiraceae bacterium]|nr:V-type ATP synthase subunit I [Oscillospiraceae bacterium]